MTHASHNQAHLPSSDPQLMAIERPLGATMPSPREMMSDAWEFARTDRAIEVEGFALGTLGGFTVAKVVEGMPTRPSKAQVQASYTATSAARGGAPPMAHVTHAQELTIAGGTVVGLLAAVAFTSLRARRRR